MYVILVWTVRYIFLYLNFQECIANYLNCLVFVDIFMNISNNHVTWLKKSTKTERRADDETTQTHSRRGHTWTAGARLVAAWASYYWMWCRGRRRRRGALRRPHTNLWHLRLRRRRLHTLDNNATRPHQAPISYWHYHFRNGVCTSFSVY